MKPRGDGSTNFVSNEEKKVQQAATEGKSSSSFFCFSLSFDEQVTSRDRKKTTRVKSAGRLLGGTLGRGGGEGRRDRKKIKR